MEEKASCCYIDTNTFLHYRMFTEIDWCKELESSHVTLVVCSAVLRELDKKKFSDPDTKVRDRAKKVISKLSEVGKGNLHAQVKADVELLFITKEPVIDWNAEGLSQDINDDRIIATILSDESTKPNVTLVTSDLGMKLKAQSKGFRCHTLPDTLRLVEKKSPAQEENVKLRERLSRLENSLPKPVLRLSSEGGMLQDFGRIPLKKITALSKEEIESQLDRIRKELQYSPPALPHTNNAFFLPFCEVSKDQVDRYNKEVDEYIKQMPEYLKGEWEHREFSSRTLTLHLVLVNEGNSPADDIDIFMYFPDGLILRSEFPKGPKPPAKPEPPKTTAEMIASFRNMNYSPDLFGGILVPPRFNRIPMPDVPKGPFIKKTNSYEVKYHVPKLKHGLQTELDPVYVIFPSMDAAHSFNINYSILAANVPEEVTGQIHIIVDKEDT
jgi:hypothetical protein